MFSKHRRPLRVTLSSAIQLNVNERAHTWNSSRRDRYFGRYMDDSTHYCATHQKLSAHRVRRAAFKALAAPY